MPSWRLGGSPSRNITEHDKRGPEHDERGPKHDERGPKHDERGPEHDERGPEHDKRGPAHDERGPAHDKRGPEHDERGPEHDERRPEHDKRGPEHDRRGPEHDKNGAALRKCTNSLEYVRAASAEFPREDVGGRLLHARYRVPKRRGVEVDHEMADANRHADEVGSKLGVDVRAGVAGEETCAEAKRPVNRGRGRDDSGTL